MNKKYNSNKNIEIGVISDTHNLLRSEATTALQGSDLIIHAGDIGSLQILENLKKIAPIVVVRGNNDKESWAEEIPIFEIIKLNDISIYVIHDIKDANINTLKEEVKIIISGHSHKPSINERDGIIYLNPGSAGPRRFKLPVTVAKIKILDTNIKAEIIELEIKSK